MILYHFTSLAVLIGQDAFDAALARAEVGIETDAMEVTLQELVPSNSDYPKMPPVVWLTTDPDPGGDRRTCTIGRIKLKIPSTDRRLIPHGAFLRGYIRSARPGMTNADIEEGLQRLEDDLPPGWMAGALAHWWAYRGTIPASKFAAVDILTEQDVWWGALGGYRIGKPALEVA